MQVLITVDTELSAALHQSGTEPWANHASSVLGRCDAGEFGIEWQMGLLSRHGLRGVYFIDPIPALVVGEEVIADIVRRVIAAGHDAQLHAHTEWLAWAPESPVAGRQGRNIGDFARDDQVRLLEYGCGMLERAGAPRPVAFRAGNFGASDDTLAALEQAGLRFDSSFNPAFQGGDCRLTLNPARTAPLLHGAVVELPVSGIEDRRGRFRPAQVCALSAWEMRAALRHGAARGQSHFTVVTHSFEMLSRDRLRPNRQVIDRFESLVAEIARHPRLETAVFGDLEELVPPPDDTPRLGPNPLRTGARLAEQAWGTLAYERA